MREKRIILTAACAAASLLAMSASAQSGLPPTSKAWGFNASLNPPSVPAGVDPRELVLDAAEAAGATHMRLGIHWSAYEKESSVADPIPASFDFPIGQATGNVHTAQVDADYLAVRERAMTPVIIVTNAPTWASTFHKCSDSVYRLLNPKLCPSGYEKGGHILYPALDRMATFTTFVTAVAERYPDAIIEGTNEPELQKAIYARFHPADIRTVAEGQCALLAGVRAAQVNPQRIVLGAGMYDPNYYTPWLQHVEGRGCYDHFSYHHYGFQAGDVQDVRSGPYSNFANGFATLRSRLQQYGNGRPFWITEVGISSTANYGQTGMKIGEDLAAHAFKPWISMLLTQEDIGGVLVHSIRDCPYAGEDCSRYPGGLGGLNLSFQVKTTGTSEMPRWCWLVLNAGNSYDGCDGLTLPPAVPMPPSFYRHPMLSSTKPTVGALAEVLFFEDGEPAPGVSIHWQLCNPVGTSCSTVGAGRYYKVPASARLHTLKAIVTIENPSGTVSESTPLSSIIM